MNNPKQEAIRLMHRMFGIQNGASNGMVESLVDSIIKAAVCECRAELDQRAETMKGALERIRDCDFVITLPDRMDAVRAIAREALE